MGLKLETSPPSKRDNYLDKRRRAGSEARRLRRSSFVERVLTTMPVLDFTLEVARTHAEILAILRSRGETLGAHDLIIAATALSAGHAVLTSDFDELSRVPGLEVLAFY